MPGHHPSHHAKASPERPALIIADTGEELSYAQLDAGSNKMAQLMRSIGLKPGDAIGMMVRNGTDFACCYWGATRCGLIVTLLSTHLKPAEAEYILHDSGAKALIVSASLGEAPLALAAGAAVPYIFFADGDPIAGARSLRDDLASQPATPVSDEISGFHMLYSSGTTGRPKGVAAPFTPGPIDEHNPSEGRPQMYMMCDPLISLNAGPLYHAAPLSGMVLTQRLGGTFVTLRKFDAEAVLKAIATYRVNHAQFVPTMFVRMLSLTDDVRAAYDVSSLKLVIHAAAPCPVEIKRRMINWWGPILLEYYSSSEGIGATSISSQDWLQRPGSVGRTSMGPIHICSDSGEELPAGQVGLIWFEAVDGRKIRYHNDPEKTKSATHPHHANWFTVGDIGRLDEDGYLYLTDRKDFMIISGGVNIYPQAIEDCLIVHPKVADAAVIGIANADYGEEVKAIVEPKAWADAGPDFEAELRHWCAERISPVTCPRSYEFVRALPRLSSGKLAKHDLRNRFGTNDAIS